MYATLSALALTGALLASSPTQDETALRRGLEAVQAGHIEADLYFLADDVLRGRDTPSREQRVAARYLRARLQALGFQPGGEDGGFFDRYSLAIRKLDVEGSSLTLEVGGDARRLAFGEDYYLGSSLEAADHDVAGEVVFCGEGRRADFAALSPGVLKGRWAFCLDRGTRTISRRNLAREGGALGILVTPGPEYQKEPYPERHARSTGDLVQGALQRQRGGTTEKREIYPQVFLAPEVGAPLAAGARLGQVLDVRAHEVRRAQATVELENVCGLFPGSDPALRNEVILVSAHYDHVGQRGEAIYNGADDNGSGTTGLLAVGEALVAHGPLKRSVLLIWVSGEEKGLLGSAAWAKEPTLPEGMRAVCNLNIDMIGRNAPERLGLTPSESHPKASFLTAIARELAPQEGFPELESADRYYDRSDQASFAKLDIPVCFLFAGEHEDYHKPTDTPDKIDYDKVHRVARLIFRMLVRLEREPL
ncbi:MAG: M28 family peptidase [Planctomycetota bacterium]